MSFPTHSHHLVPTTPFTVCERAQSTLQTVQQNYTTCQLVKLFYGQICLSQRDPDDLSWDSWSSTVHKEKY